MFHVALISTQVLVASEWVLVYSSHYCPHLPLPIVILCARDNKEGWHSYMHMKSNMARHADIGIRHYGKIMGPNALQTCR